MHPNRRQSLQLVNETQALAQDASMANKRVSEYFGELTFGLRAMQEYLPREDYAALKKVIGHDHKLDEKLAASVAGAVKNWAIAQGATHYCHWFQPMTGATAEKHDSFLSLNDDSSAIEKFGAAQLIQSEPDASSFPSGGMRSTFEARGYTAWDVSSAMFIADYGNTRVLCIPSVFVSYTGHSLDTKTGLLRSSDALSAKACELLQEMGDNKISSVHSTVGLEQEYFLIDKNYVQHRPDLLLTGRTLLGADMPKGQQLEDHYFASIPTRVRAFMSDAERELYRLGIPVKTRHNEVAPSQFELAPIFEESNLAIDHNMLTMDVLKRVAEKHGFVCLLHEKPFAGINGSGKHTNWSLATSGGENLLEPGKTPHSNVRFLAFLSCITRAVYKQQIALRAAISGAGNDHRLGANEAPPAIMSVFMGSTLNEILDSIEAGKDLASRSAEQSRIEFGINKLPSLPKDSTDRNRTSPFAFTGNKFEFRAVGSSQAPSFAVALLNAAVTESIEEFTKRLKEQKGKASSVDSAILAVVKEFVTESKAIRFEGDGYSQEWRDEAKRRGLQQLMNTPVALEAFSRKESYQFLMNTGVYSEDEVKARITIRLEQYIKQLNIEAQTLMTMVRQHVLPAAFEYQGKLGAAAAALKELEGSRSYASEKTLFRTFVDNVENTAISLEKLEHELKAVQEGHDELKIAKGYAEKVMPLMLELRSNSEKLESLVPDDMWPLPKYREMLFIR